MGKKYFKDYSLSDCLVNSVYNYSRACGIPDEETVIITGGTYSQTTVSVYSVEGWQQDLPPLNTGRFGHACSSYWSDGRRVK